MRYWHPWPTLPVAPAPQAPTSSIASHHVHAQWICRACGKCAGRGESRLSWSRPPPTWSNPRLHLMHIDAFPPPPCLQLPSYGLPTL